MDEKEKKELEDRLTRFAFVYRHGKESEAEKTLQMMVSDVEKLIQEKVDDAIWNYRHQN